MALGPPETEYTQATLLRDLLPDLPSTTHLREFNPVQINIDFDIGRNGEFPSQTKDLVDNMWIIGHIKVQHGEFVRFRVFVSSDEGGMTRTAPIKIRWEVKLYSKHKMDVGAKSCFIPIPMQGTLSKSSFIQIDWDDIPPRMRQGMIGSEWNVSIDWYTEDEIKDHEDRASASLHHLADVLEDLKH